MRVPRLSDTPSVGEEASKTSVEQKTDYYEVLGVAHDADAKTIKRAFLKKARTLHPDVCDAPDAEERFKEVNEAYSVLSDEQRRANYDRFGDPDGPAGFGGGVDMSDIFGGFGMDDIFSSFFGGGGNGGGRATRTAGRDMGISLSITLAEAAAGCTKTLAYDRLAPCDDCGGTGAAEGGHLTTCAHCHGTGRVVTVQNTILGQMQSQSTCPDCQGTGKVIDHPCPTCNGQGRTPTHETVKIDIPAGVYSGQTIKVAGYGEAGLHNDRAGDLMVRVEIAEDERFQRQGDDLFCVEEISAFEAMLGCEFDIDGILEDEQIHVTIPAGCQYGQQLEFENCGMPRMGTGARGKLVVIAHVTIPEDINPEQQDLLRSIAQARHERIAGSASDETATSEDAADSSHEGIFGKHTGRAASAKPAHRRKRAK